MDESIIIQKFGEIIYSYGLGELYYRDTFLDRVEIHLDIGRFSVVETLPIEEELTNKDFIDKIVAKMIDLIVDGIKEYLLKQTKEG